MMDPMQFNITGIDVMPVSETRSPLRAYVKIVLNKSLVLSGLKLMRGPMGHYLMFPSHIAHRLYQYGDASSFVLRKKMERAVIRVYMKQILSELRAVG